MEGFDRLMGMGLPSKTKENSSSFYSGSSGLTRSRDSRTKENKAWRALWRGGKVKWWMVHCRGFRVGGGWGEEGGLTVRTGEKLHPPPPADGACGLFGREEDSLHPFLECDMSQLVVRKFLGL